MLRRDYRRRVARPPGDRAGVEWTVDLGTQFCERCGQDRDTVTSARGAYRDCPRCGAACCADCWNLVDAACLKCAPFRLVDPPASRHVVAAPAAIALPVSSGGDSGPAPGAAAPADPYRDLRDDDVAGQPTVERRPAWKQPTRRPAAQPDTISPQTAARPPVQPPVRPAATQQVAMAAPSARSRPRRRAGRVGLAAATAWVVVAAIAMVAFGSTPGMTPAPLEVLPSSETPATSATPGTPATIAPSGSIAPAGDEAGTDPSPGAHPPTRQESFGPSRYASPPGPGAVPSRGATPAPGSTPAPSPSGLATPSATPADDRTPRPTPDPTPATPAPTPIRRPTRRPSPRRSDTRAHGRPTPDPTPEPDDQTRHPSRRPSRHPSPRPPRPLSDRSLRRWLAAPSRDDRYGRTWRRAKSTLAGRSASRRMYHGYQCFPYAISV